VSTHSEPRSRGWHGLLSPRPATAPAGATAGGTGIALPGTAAARSVAAQGRDSLPLRLVAFAALAAFATSHWTMLVENAPAGRTLVVLLVATGGAAVIGLLSLAPLPRPVLHALAAIAGVATLCLGLMAAGLPGRLLLPAHWSELTDGLDRGLAGVQGVDWPYDGPDEWIRRTILLGAPALLAISATLTFWPARRGAAALRIAGLVTMLLLYGTAVTEQDPGAPALRGLVLLLLIAAWLWLPRMPRREAGIAAAVVASVGLISLPLAAALDADRAWWDYHAWSWFGDGEAIRFDWTHEYGPLNWSRAGATMLNVKSDRPHYWKAEALDTFDGLRWVRSPGADDNRFGPEVAYSGSIPQGRWDYNEYNLKWDERIRFTVRSLSSDMVVGAGITLDVDGIPGARPSSDGTTLLPPGRRLERGDTYYVRTYAPNPTKAQMEGVVQGYSDNLIANTEIHLPNPGESATEGIGLQGDAAREQAALRRPVVFVPLRGNADPKGDARFAERTIRNSPYRRMYDLAQSLTADQPTAYAAVKNVEQYLQSNYTYSERVPTRPIPLMGFLYQERRGYCQQFSGTMALMLRMVGIPARVAAGFSPGSFNKDTEEYRVRDLDAHSWVEVWFQGIGWVPFDPTPARSPAQSQSSALATSAAAADAGEVRQTRQGVAAERGSDTGAALGSDGGNSWLVPVLLLLLAAPLAAGALVFAARVRHLRHLGPGEVAELQLSELRRALLRLGWDLPPSTTLLGLERRLGRFAGPASEAYAEALRANRYDPRAPEAPDLAERRIVRRELTRGSLADRIRGLIAFPPGAPRP
jgi:protein-glutamine gamma-glutamyltransferase